MIYVTPYLPTAFLKNSPEFPDCCFRRYKFLFSTKNPLPLLIGRGKSNVIPIKPI